jgi:hypothetical protein
MQNNGWNLTVNNAPYNTLLYVVSKNGLILRAKRITKTKWETVKLKSNVHVRAWSYV